MAQANIGHNSILLVDDEAIFREALAFSFKRKGYHVLTASNGREAYDLLQNQSIDIIISDICMPGGDGIELLDRTRKAKIETPIILLVTGFSDITTDVAYDKGADALFSKPFEYKTLEETAQRLLSPGEERRPRPADQVETNFNVELHLPCLSDAIEAKVLSLGSGGILATVDPGKYPNVNDTVTFNSGNSQLSGSGIIRWICIREAPSHRAGCGIDFTYLGAAERQQIVAMMKVS